MTWTLADPLITDRQSLTANHSGTPYGLVELARRTGDLLLAEDDGDLDLLVEYPFSDIWQEQTGYARFARLRTPVEGKKYALIRS